MNDLWTKFDDAFGQLNALCGTVFAYGGNDRELLVVSDRKGGRDAICRRDALTIDFVRYVRARLQTKDLDDWRKDNRDIVQQLDEVVRGISSLIGVRHVNERILGMMDNVMKESGIVFRDMPRHHQNSIIKHLNGVSGVLSKYAKGGV